MDYANNEKLDDWSKGGLGSYEFIGTLTNDGSAVYVYSGKPSHGLLRTFIVLSSTWIGTVMTLLP